MLTTRELQEEIIKYKKLNDICILAHAYQPHEITEIADFVGDSFGLSQKAAAADNKTILMCGVRFMAETAKILSPQKRVLLSNSEAGCPMAEQLSLSGLKELKKQFPNCFSNNFRHCRRHCVSDHFILIHLTADKHIIIRECLYSRRFSWA